jgi:hypothetical protein
MFTNAPSFFGWMNIIAVVEAFNQTFADGCVSLVILH